MHLIKNNKTFLIYILLLSHIIVIYLYEDATSVTANAYNTNLSLAEPITMFVLRKKMVQK